MVDEKELSRREFPSEFLFGVSSLTYQVGMIAQVKATDKVVVTEDSTRVNKTTKFPH